jgi:hypothetical protein
LRGISIAKAQKSTGIFFKKYLVFFGATILHKREFQPRIESYLRRINLEDRRGAKIGEDYCAEEDKKPHKAEPILKWV